jgi:G3E family GTPase
MGLESSLMKDSEGNDIPDFYEMPNGCICCSGKGDLINTLDNLLSKKQLDYVLVEVNGLADPSQIIQTFWVDDGLGSMVTLHQTIALVDVKSFSKKIANHEIVQAEEKEDENMVVEGVLFYDVPKKTSFTESQLLIRQLLFADKILLNKVDLLSAEEKE